jgi:peroxiredoxin Q/BCP
MRHAVRWFTGVWILSGCLLAAGADPTGKLLQVGDAAPEFKCLDDHGQTWSSKDHIGKRILVVYFYPGDFSFCCTRQAERYRDRMTELANRGVDVVGISGDAVAAHRAFRDTHCLNFTLLSDGDGTVARQFGVPLRAGGKALVTDTDGSTVVDETGKAIKHARDFTVARWTYVIGRDGRILYCDTAVSPIKDSQEVLEFISRLGVE